jgi:hypothetical protein
VLNEAPRHEDVLGSGGIAPRILNLGTRWRWVVGFTPRPLYPQGKSPRYPLDRRLGGTRAVLGAVDEEKNSLPLPCQPVTQRYTDWAITALVKKDNERNNNNKMDERVGGLIDIKQNIMHSH